MRLKLFWSMATYVERLQAADQLANLNLMTMAQHGDAKAQQKLREELTGRIGAPTPAPKQEKSDKSEILALIQEI